MPSVVNWAIWRADARRLSLLGCVDGLWAVSACVSRELHGSGWASCHSAPVGKPPTARQIAQLTTLGIQAGPDRHRACIQQHNRQGDHRQLTGLPTAVPPKSGPGASTARQSVRLVMADLDHFKPLNDSRGHAAGVQASGFVAETCVLSLRNGDMADAGAVRSCADSASLQPAQAQDSGGSIRAKLAGDRCSGNIPASRPASASATQL